MPPSVRSIASSQHCRPAAAAAERFLAFFTDVSQASVLPGKACHLVNASQNEQRCHQLSLSVPNEIQ